MQTDISTTIEQVTAAIAELPARVAGLHAAAALAQHCLLRDAVLRRMLPASRPNA